MLLSGNHNHTHKERHDIFWRWHIDLPLLLGLIVLIAFGLIVLYSATGESMYLLKKQLASLSVALVVLVVCAQIPPRIYRGWAPWLYLIGVLLLIGVLFFGISVKGSQRWLNLGIVRFQPSELLKLAVPMMLAWYYCEHPLPPKFKYIVVGLILLMIPTLLIFRQPDLGTAIFIGSSGIFIIWLAGISWRIVLTSGFLAVCYAPIHWFFFMHEYQKTRVMTLFNPEADKWGSGYQIIQSKIAIGSGGIYGKGWLQGSQSQLEFLPESHNDFIFAVLAEDFGLTGIITLFGIYLFLIGRGLYIGLHAQDSFGRLLAGSIILTFFVYIFVNVGMVSGILPVVGLPLPLVSYGGTSMVTMMASFGILMSIHTHRRLLTH
jgi:rod shape determining protein RodA